jgi:hypothetical protein
MNNVHYMKADLEIGPGKPDISPLIGTWVNTNPATRYITKLLVGERDGALTTRIYGAGSPEPVDWGEVEANPYVSGGSTDAVGFHTSYDFGAVETSLAANYKLGILVIQSYTRYKDQSGRLDHFSREFFHREDRNPSLSERRQSAQSGASDTAESRPETAGQVEITPLLGTWLNSNHETRWIKKFSLARKGDAFTLRAFSAAEPFDWGEREVSTYMDNIGELAFHAIYDLGFVESTLAANTNKGLIVIAAFHKFKDNSGRANFLCREFYYREL